MQGITSSIRVRCGVLERGRCLQNVSFILPESTTKEDIRALIRVAVQSTHGFARRSKEAPPQVENLQILDLAGDDVSASQQRVRDVEQQIPIEQAIAEGKRALRTTRLMANVA